MTSLFNKKNWKVLGLAVTVIERTFPKLQRQLIRWVKMARLINSDVGFKNDEIAPMVCAKSFFADGRVNCIQFAMWKLNSNFLGGVANKSLTAFILTINFSYITQNLS